MPSIDERIVSMVFENQKFEQAVKVTMGTLGKLQTSLGDVGKTKAFTNLETDAAKVKLSGPQRALDVLRGKLSFREAVPGFASIENAANKVQLFAPHKALDTLKGKLGFPSAPRAFADLENSSAKVTFQPVSNAIDNIGIKLGALQTAATVAFGTIVSKATVAGGNLAKSIGIGPITQGFEEYSTNLNSIQTILANTQVSGANLTDVNAALTDLNEYSDKTIYNFGEMARAIGLFTAAGVDLDTSTGSIKGISNLAALSGSNSQQAATVMQQLSQAISSGKVGLQDWNSVVNAGMGGSAFQRALATTAQNMGKIKDGALELKGPMKNVTIDGESFRESISGPGPSWLTSDVLTSTLEQLTGDMTDAELQAKGFTEEQIKSIQQTAKSAQKAATEVKTLKGVMDVAKETIGSGWSATFQNIFGDFEEAKNTFTDLSETINGFVNRNADARNKVLKEWKKLGGRTDLIEGIKAAFEALGAVLKPIRQAFRDIFPRKTGKDLADLTKRFRDFAEGLKIDPDTADALRRTFAGVFAVLHIVTSVIGNVIKLFGRLFGAAEDGGGSFLNFTGGIGDFLVAIDNALTKGGALEAFFGALEAIIKVPLSLVQDFGKALGSMFSGDGADDADKTKTALDNLSSAVEPLKRVLEQLGGAWDYVADKMKAVGDFLAPIIESVLEELRDIGDIVAKEFKKINWDQALEALETGLIAGIFLKIKDLFTGNLSIDVGGGAIGNLSKAMETLTDNLKAIQRNIQANTLLQIATAVVLLAGGITVISNIDGEKLQKAMTAIAVGLGELLAAMALLGAASKGLPIVGMPLIAASLVLLAGAIVILAGAIKIMSGMDWEEMGRGLAGVAGALIVVGIGTRAMNPAMTLAAAATLIPLAIGLNLLGSAVKIFASMSWEDMAKGILGLAGALAAIGLALTLMPATVTLIGPGLFLVAIALTLIGGAVKTFGEMDLKEMGQGILGIAGALAAIGLAISLIPPTIVAQAAGLVILGVALVGIGAAVALFGSMDIPTLVKGIAAIGAMLVVMAIGLTAMSGTLLGSVALLGAAAAFAVLAPALFAMGNMKWSVILKGLAVMALTLGVLAVVGALASGPLMSLGIAIAVLGGGLLVVATAFFVFSAALAKLGVEGPKGIAALTAAVSAFILILPDLIIDFVKGMLSILDALTGLAPKIVVALGKMLAILFQFIKDQSPKLAQAAIAFFSALLDVLVGLTPKIIDAAGKIITSLIQGLADNVGPLVNAGANLIVNFLTGLGNAIPRVVTAAERVARKFLNALSDGLVGLIDAGFDALIRFLNGLENAIRENGPRLREAGWGVADAILDGIVDGFDELGDKMLEAAEKLLGKLPKAMRKVLGIKSPSTVAHKIGTQVMLGLANGLDSQAPAEAMASTAKSVVDAAKDGFGKVPDVLGDVVQTDPVITPVLDLSKVDKEAQKLDNLTNVVPITAAASFDSASAISAETAAAALAAAEAAQAEAVAPMQFTQNNYSPESLSDVEIYRQTNNQLSLAKSKAG